MTSGLGGWEGLLGGRGWSSPLPHGSPPTRPIAPRRTGGRPRGPSYGPLESGTTLQGPFRSLCREGCGSAHCLTRPPHPPGPPPCPSTPSAPARLTPYLGWGVVSICRKPSQGPTASELLQRSQRESPPSPVSLLPGAPCLQYRRFCTYSPVSPWAGGSPSVPLGGSPTSPT